MWQYDVGKFSSDYSRVLLSSDQNVYYSVGNAVVSLAQPTRIGGNGVIIVAIVALDHPARSLRQNAMDETKDQEKA